MKRQARTQHPPIAENLVTDPKSPDFLKGADDAKKWRILKQQAPEKYEAFMILLNDCLRRVFRDIGEDIDDAARGFKR